MIATRDAVEFAHTRPELDDLGYAKHDDVPTGGNPL
jgi:hypothetical protein